MAQVIARQGESIDSLWKRFKKAVGNDGDVKRFTERYTKKGGYLKPSEARRQKHALAMKRKRKDQLKRESLQESDFVKERARLGGESTIQRPQTIRYDRAA